MKHAAAIAHFRQLCCLSLDSQTLMPTVLQTLHELIGSDSNGFYWSTQPGRITNVYSEESMPRAISALFFDEFLNNRKRPDAAIHIGNLMRPGQVVGNNARLFPTEFYDSDNYHLIWRPLRRKWLLWAMLHDLNGNTHTVSLRRLTGETPFSIQDEQRLAQLVPYLEHALNASALNSEAFVDHGESGLIVIDQRGEIGYQSEDGQRLLLLAAHPTISSGSIEWRAHGALPPQLRLLCARLNAIGAGHSAPRPIEMIENRWGKFVFRAHHLNATGNADSLIGITIQRHVPLALKLMANMRVLNLSTRQKDVCLLIAQGKSHSAIATQLDVSPTTIADHVHKIYDKLGVRSHNALITRLSENETQRQRH
jgi:DNA-binding CsgD family transcriptional regulator